MRVSRMTMVALAAVAAGCAGSTGGGCSGGVTAPIPEGFPREQVKTNAAVVRISPQGFTYLNDNWLQLITPLLPGATQAEGSLVYAAALPCMAAPVSFDIPVIGTIGTTVMVCDNGASGPGSTGFMDGACNGDSPCPMLVTIDAVRIDPKGPSGLAVEVDVRIDATKDLQTGELGSIYIDTFGNDVCPGIPLISPNPKPLGCLANYHSEGRGTRDNENLKTTIKFALEQNWNGQLTFDVAPPDPTKPDQVIGGLDQVEAADIEVLGCDEQQACGQQGVDWCDLPCSAANLGFVKDLLINNVIKPQLQTVIRDVVSGLRCRKCNPSDPLVLPCPNEGVDSFCDCADGGANCLDEERICISSAARGGECVPPLLGVEQYLNLGALLAPFGADPSGRLATFAAAGGGLQIDTGLQVAMLGGVEAGERAACVPPSEPPARRDPPAPDLTAAGPANHHLGLAVSEYFLNYAMWQAHRSGAACISISTAQAAPLTTGLFKTFLPSLGMVAGSENADAPMMISLRPLESPVLHVGEGTFDAQTGKVTKPLLTLELRNVHIDFYAMIEGRYARLFTLGADVKLPLSLAVEGCPTTLLPVLGDLKSMITIRSEVPANSEILAEDPQVLAQLVPMVMGMAEPALAALLQPIPLPDMGAFRVHVDELKGVSRIGATDDFNYLGAFATFGMAGECATRGPKTRARLVSSRMPSREQMRLVAGRELPWPSAVIEVGAEDLPGQSRAMEYAWRVDGGLWSTWQPGTTLEVSHPAMVLPGKHLIEVRARVAGEPALVDRQPAAVELLVDWDEPTLGLSVDRDANRITVEARDAVSPAQALQYAYRLGSGALSGFGPARTIDLAAAEEAGGLEVQVRDEAGNVASARWGLRDFAQRGDSAAAATVGAGQGEAAGCSSAGAGLAGLWAFLLLPAALRRRRS